jgi:hypothetical protein
MLTWPATGKLACGAGQKPGGDYAMSEQESTHFNIRAFIALLNAGLFVVLALTGTTLWAFGCSPFVHWIHVHAALAFMLVGSLHSAYNWKPLRSYARIAANANRSSRRNELPAALGAGLFVILSALTHRRRGWRRR